MKKIFTKSAVLAIALLSSSCAIIPIPIPIPIAIDSGSAEASHSPSPEQSATKLDEKYKKTCYADALTEDEGRKVTESSGSLEVLADKLAATGKHKEAIRKYNEASASAMSESIADGSMESMDVWDSLHGEGVEGFKKENQALLQKSAESNFKIGRSYVQIGKIELAIDCFNEALKLGILPPNDAVVHLNRGDTHARMGAKDKAKADLKQAVVLFKKYKLPSYQKEAEKRLEAIK
ncbi:tetratricopeptide repeat protein [Microcoleus anatoxicus]|uniref:Tetratricopeptide repeat protein n=1 Tax=Microcoleus anatoxicus PTRS2 TaxID=2705321 RepID=A0ABU8YPZ6_9CYAN